jgi:hypothetical protein
MDGALFGLYSASLTGPTADFHDKPWAAIPAEKLLLLLRPMLP